MGVWTVGITPVHTHYNGIIRDPSTKIDTPHRMASYSIKKIFEEARKCDIRCANCHAIRTVEEKHYAERKQLDEAGMGH